MKKSLLLTLCIAGSISGLSGCATTASDCDPSNTNAGFGTNLGCALGGRYKERQNQLEDSLRQEQSNKAALSYEKQQLAKEKSMVGSAVKQRKAQLNNMQKSIDQMKKKVAGNKKLQNEVNQLEQQLKNLQSSGNTASEAQKASEAARLQKRLQQLRQQASEF